MSTKKVILVLLISLPLVAGPNNAGKRKGIWENYCAPIQKQSKIDPQGKLNFVIENNWVAYTPQKEDGAEIDASGELDPRPVTVKNKEKKWFGYSVDQVRDKGARVDSRKKLDSIATIIRKNNQPQTRSKTRSEEPSKISSIRALLIPEQHPTKEDLITVVHEYMDNATNGVISGMMALGNVSETLPAPRTDTPSDRIE